MEDSLSKRMNLKPATAAAATASTAPTISTTDSAGAAAGSSNTGGNFAAQLCPTLMICDLTVITHPSYCFVHHLKYVDSCT
jgi:hypothetical protein